MPVPGLTAAIAPATSPSVMRRMRAPASRTSSMYFWWRGRSRIVIVMFEVSVPFAFAARRMFSPIGRRRSTTSAISAPTASFSM